MRINKTEIAFGTKGKITKGAVELVRKLHGDESAKALKNTILHLKENACKYDTLAISTEPTKTANVRKFKNTRFAIPMAEKGSKNLRIKYKRVTSDAQVYVDESLPVSLLRNILKSPANIEEFIKNVYARHSRGDGFLFPVMGRK